MTATFESVASPEKPTPPVQQRKPSSCQTVTPPVHIGTRSPNTTAVTPPVHKGTPGPSTTTVTPPAHKEKPSPSTGDKTTQPTARKTNPLEKQLQAMQRQLQEQASLIAGFQKAETKPVDPMQEKIRLLEEQLQKQAEIIKQHQAGKDPAPMPKAPKATAPPTSESGDAAKTGESLDADSIIMPDGTKVISHDALRMRLKRLCEKKKSGKSWVSEELMNDWKSGGSSREALEIALLETIKELGAEAPHQKMRVPVTHYVGTHCGFKRSTF